MHPDFVRKTRTVRIVAASGVALVLAGCGTPVHRGTNASSARHAAHTGPATTTTAPTTTSTTATTTPPASVGAASRPTPPPPVRILFAGDSMSGSLAVGVAQVASQYGAEVVNEGQATCAPTIDQMVRIKTDLVAPKAPCVPGDPAAIVADMRSWVQQFDPDVVVYLARSDLFDDEVNGTWLAVGEPAADTFVSSQMNATVAALSSGGAHVVIVTNPSYDSGTQPNGSPWPEDTSGRVAADNAVLRQVASTHGATTSVIEGAPLLDPSAGASSGVAVRCPDGVHVSPAGGVFFARHVLAELVQLGRAHATANPRRPPLPPQPSRPAWWPEIQCGP